MLCQFGEFLSLELFLSKWKRKSQERIARLMSGLSFGDVALILWEVATILALIQLMPTLNQLIATSPTLAHP